MLEHLNEILDSTQITTSTAAVRLAISFVLGAIIGAERQFRRRDAGMRTFTLICMGSAAAMLISIWIPQTYPNFLNGDPGRIAAQVLTGIGFLGAGAIIQSHGSVHGLTTAACIWVMAAVGDGANDLPMISIAGLGIAFHAKPKVKATAKQSISTIGLDGILYFLGYKDSYLDEQM